MSELPLFPLQTVLFPAGRLALRVFEPRYLDMVTRCLRAENRFGVVAIRQGAEVGAATPFDYGTSATIVDWHQEQPGVLGLVVEGCESFRLHAVRREPDGLYVGEVEWLPAPHAERLSPAHAPLAELLRRLMEPLPLYRGTEPAFEDAAWVGGRLIELLPVALGFKQSLLELANPRQRLDRLAAVLAPLRGSE